MIKRVLVKFTGEALAGEDGYGIDTKILKFIADKVDVKREKTTNQRDKQNTAANSGHYTENAHEKGCEK